jgi:diketogulonate reductase-like aldo/keto reductase
MEHIDAFLVHWPIAAQADANRMPKLGADGRYVIKHDLTENPQPTWRAMEAIYRSSKARTIGVSNWTVPGLKKLLSFAEVKLTINQVEIQPCLPNTELVNFCVGHNILPAA